MLNAEPLGFNDEGNVEVVGRLQADGLRRERGHEGERARACGSGEDAMLSAGGAVFVRRAAIVVIVADWDLRVGHCAISGVVVMRSVVDAVAGR